MQHGTMTVMAKGTHPQLRRHVPKVHRKLAEKKNGYLKLEGS